jgi:hypothetical protein
MLSFGGANDLPQLVGGDYRQMEEGWKTLLASWPLLEEGGWRALEVGWMPRVGGWTQLV